MSEGDRLNFYRLSLLIIDGGTPTLKRLFEKQYAASGDLEIFLNSRTTVLDGLYRRKIINQMQMDLLRPSTGIKPSVEKFDTSLLITLLTNICPIQPPSCGWKVSPAASDLCPGADILRVRDARNNLFHHARCSISDAEFQLESSNVSDVISRLSNQLDQQQQENIQKIINDARNAASDFGREKEIFNQIFLDKMDEIHRLLQGIYDRINDGAITGLAVSEASHSLQKDEKNDGTKDQPDIDMHGENMGIWQSIIQQICGAAAASLMESICQTFLIEFIRAERGSLVLIFKAGDNFSIELLQPESVKKKVRELLEKTCPEHHPLLKDPIHVTIVIKSANYGDKEEIHFVLETIKDRKEIEDGHSHFGRHERDYMIEEMDPTPLKQWLFERLKIDECTQIHLEDIISWNDIGRGEKMKILIDTLERFEDGYELLQRYCEENDKVVYDKVFQKARQQSRTNHKTELGYDTGEGMQKLFSTWIDFSEDPTGSDDSSDENGSDQVTKSCRKLPKMLQDLQDSLSEYPDDGQMLKQIEQSVEEELNQAGIKMSTKERDLFIKFQYEIGTDIYFRKGSHRLIDGQETLKATETFLEQSRPDMKEKWLEYKSQGILTPELIDIIYSEERNPELHNKKDEILGQMEVLNIIVKARSFDENGVKEDNYYVAPCMFRLESSREFVALEQDPCLLSTSVLCWVFTGTFVPASIFDELIAACIARWPIAKEKDTSKHLISPGSAVFEVNPTHKLTLNFDNHDIFATVSSSVLDDINTLDAKLCTIVRMFISRKLSKITNSLKYNLKYELCVQSQESQDVSKDSMIRFSPFQIWFNDEIHDPESPIQREHMNFARLYIALVTVCGKALREILLDNFPVPYRDIYQAIMANQARLIGVRGRPLLNQEQINLVFPDPLGQKTGTVESFNLSLLYTLIRNVSTVNAPSTGWGNDPQPSDTSLGASVERIRSYRKRIMGRSPEAKISDNNFKDYWTKFKDVLDDIEVGINKKVYSKELERQKRQVISIFDAS